MKWLPPMCFELNSVRLTMVLGAILHVFGGTSGFAADPIQHSMFSGSLIRPGNEDGDILRRFDVQLLSTGNTHFFHVIDDPRSGCPWPESFGPAGPAVGTDRVQPHLVYTYQDHAYLIGLPPLVLQLPQGIEPGTIWDSAGWQMTAVEEQKINNSPAWIVEARERRGRQQTLTIDSASGITLRAEADVFMGQGDQFRLTMARSASSTLQEAVADKVIELQKDLSTLQATLKRRPDSHLNQLSARQISDIDVAMERLTSQASATPLEILIRQMKSDTEQQKKRLEQSNSRAGALINTDAPPFSLSLIGGGNLESASLRGRIVILHFWDYRDAPLSEPYGQTGYLEFLYNQKKKMNIAVVGISTNADLQSAENLNRGKRSARKLSEFMNLTYPIGYNDGSLLEAFGDPRASRGQLPLWIVLTSDGKVAHYHAGFYEVDAAQGLKELETVLSGLAEKP